MSETPQSRLEAEVKAAMRARDRERTQTLRLLLGAVKNRRIELGDELDESEFLKIVRRSIKQRQEAAEQYQQGGRHELAAKESAEAEILEGFLPPAPDDEQVRAAMREVIDAQGLAGPKGMGPLMKAMKERFGETVDGRTLSAMARELLGS